MEKLFEIHKISNGYLTVFFNTENDKKVYKSFQVDARNPQVEDMFKYLIKTSKEKGIRIVSESDYISIQRRQ